MHAFKYLALVVVAGIFLAVAAPKNEAQTTIVKPEPQCPYGYFDHAPYACAPYGYYSSEWFLGEGMFIGAGPWFHGPDDFRGHVDNRLDPQHGYTGTLPTVGESPDHSKRLDKIANFKGNEWRDGRGNDEKH